MFIIICILIRINHHGFLIRLQRVKIINFGSEDKMLTKKPTKSKILDSLKNDTIPASPKIPQSSKPMSSLTAKKSTSPANNSKAVSITSRKSLSSSLTTKKPASGSQSRKTMNGNVEQPKNTIKSMFQKQMEKTQSANDSISDRMAAIDLAKVPASPKSVDMVLLPGSLHKRVTRRNSMSMSQASDNESDQTSIGTPTKNKESCRKTMFTPRVSDVMEEDKSPAVERVTNKTVNESAMMDIDRAISNKCNNTKISQNGNSFIVDTPTDAINQKRWLLDSLSKRKTFYTPQPIDETSMLENRMTPPVNQTSLNFTMNDTPSTQDLIKKSTRAADKTSYGKCDKYHQRNKNFRISFHYFISFSICRLV